LRLATSSSARFGAASPTQLAKEIVPHPKAAAARVVSCAGKPATAAAMRAENAAASASRSASRAASSSASTRPAIAAKARRRLRSARLSYADIQVRAAGRASPPTPRSNRRAGSPANGRGALALRRLEIDEGGSGPACGISPCGHGRSVTPELRRPFADLQKSLRSK
jgi:hypothetical protein